MYTKKLLFVLLLVLGSSACFAQFATQEYELKLGPFFRVSKRSVPIGFIGNDAHGFYVYYANGKTGLGKRSFVKFDYDLNLVGELKLNQPGSFGSMASETVFNIDGNIYQVLTQSVSNSVNTGNRRVEVLLQKINQEAMSLGSLIPVTSISGQGYWDDNIAVHLSSDSAMVALSYSVPVTSKSNDEIGFHLFDKAMNQLWETKIVLPYKDKLLRVQKLLVNREGEVFILGKRFYNKVRNKVKGEVNYDYLLFHYDRAAGLDSVRIEIKDKYLTDVRMELDSNDDLICAGFYSSKGVSTTEGIFYRKINGTTNEIMIDSKLALDKDFITQNMSAARAARMEKRIAKGKDVELPFFNIDEFLVDGQGNTRMIAEQRLIYTTTTYTQYGTYSSTHYDYDDVMIIHINSKGEIEWKKRIAKNQHTVNDGAIYSSYSKISAYDNLYLFYNDNVVNLNYNGVGRVAPMAKNSTTTVVMATVSPDGKIKKTPLLNRESADMKIRPSLSNKVSDTELLLFGHKGLKNQRFILMNIKKP